MSRDLVGEVIDSVSFFWLFSLIYPPGDAVSFDAVEAVFVFFDRVHSIFFEKAGTVFQADFEDVFSLVIENIPESFFFIGCPFGSNNPDPSLVIRFQG